MDQDSDISKFLQTFELFLASGYFFFLVALNFIFLNLLLEV